MTIINDPVVEAECEFMYLPIIHFCGETFLCNIHHDENVDEDWMWFFMVKREGEDMTLLQVEDEELIFTLEEIIASAVEKVDEDDDWCPPIQGKYLQ